MDGTGQDADDALRMAREREDALRKILDVISRSRDDEQPVFDAILQNAARYFNAAQAGLHLLNDAGTHLTFVAHWGDSPTNFEVGAHQTPVDKSGLSRVVLEAAPYQVDDLAESELYKARDPVRVKMVEEDGLRTMLAVPLISSGHAIGSIALCRTHVESFSQGDVALAETFAAQAVIAIENVRQFRELQTRLEREKATREILAVISRSRDDESPVFDVILENAARLCRSSMARLHLLEDGGDTRRLAAHWGEELRTLQIGETMPMDGGHPISRTIREARVIHVEDMETSDLYLEGDPLFTRLVEEEGLRTLLTVPLLRGAEGFGCIALSRRDAAPFRDDEIALVETFAAQAAIAIENVRQFRELQTRLEREKATGEVLEVISRSRDDERPVFQIIVDRSAALCGAATARLHLANDAATHFTLSASWGPDLTAYPIGHQFPLQHEGPVATAITERRVVAVDDLALAEGLYELDEHRLNLIERDGVRSYLTVPLIRGQCALGAIALGRQERRSFEPGEIALIETFAAQAVIAIENVRQFRALEERTEEVQVQAEELAALNASLEERVEAQVGEIERMGKLKSFLPSAVADAVVSSGSDDMLKSHRALLGILFCDIRGFTAFCETAEPEETIEVLQAYHQEMGRLIAAHGAGVDHRMGDGIMVLFNDPLPCDDPAGAAVRLAMAMRERMAGLCREWKKLGHRLGFGVGVSLGYATVGMVGYEERSEYTASGTAVNLAARLCDRAEDGEILLSPRAAIAVEDDVICEPGGVLELKGLTGAVEVMRAVALRGGAS